MYQIVYFFNVFRKSTDYAQARLHLTLFAIPFRITWVGQVKDITQTESWRMICVADRIERATVPKKSPNDLYAAKLKDRRCRRIIIVIIKRVRSGREPIDWKFVRRDDAWQKLKKKKN